MTVRVSLCVSVLCVLFLICSAADVDENCRTKLLEKDPHLSAYIGQVFTIEATHTNKKDDKVEEEHYTYLVGVCISAVDTDRFSGCGIVQYNATDHTKAVCVGKITSPQVSRTADGVWIELTYPNGDPYGHHCNGAARLARLIFLCDPLINGMGRFDFLEENRDENVCFYTFSLAAKAVCGSLLSAGDIILILFACLALLWAAAMLGGCLFKRFIQGAKGLEQIPLLEWYREFGNLEADGCDIVCRSRKRLVPEYREPTFGADTDDEDEKDDNLLPM